MIRVYLVDDDTVVADGLAARLAQEPDIAVVGSATRLDVAVHRIARLRPDVVVSDVLFGESPEGLDLAVRLAATLDAPPPVLLLSSYAADYFQRSALQRGAAGYILKRATTADVCTALRIVAAGGTAFAASVLRPGERPRPPSQRERQVIAAVSRGGGNDDIGRRLGITRKTVESHLSRMFARYGVSGRTELAVLAVRERWLPAGDQAARDDDGGGRAP